MLELYSLNIDVAAGGDIPFNSSNFEKGCTAIHSAPATVSLNKKGVYRVACNASVEPTAAGEVGIQLIRDGVAVAAAQSVATGEVDTITTLNFETLVKVPYDNTCCCTSSPVTLQVINTAQGDVNYPIVRIIVNKLC